MTTATLETSLTLHGSRNLQVLLLCVGILVVLGTIMIGSASMDVAAQHYGDGFYYLHRQLIFVVLAMLMGIVTVHVPMAWWLRSGWLLLFVG
ncbi:MAG: FtsW/RodA/SpoVE family cell cycle protein, partial [Gammaproteobacteria bacterium]|nr:FtsW/RodA/SpoVE family cell cycle protein [Gammaproteobacteria bacterium]